MRAPSLVISADGTTSNLSGGWSTLWGKITSAYPNLSPLMTSIGIIIVVLAAAKYVWEKRRGGGGNTNALVWSLVIGGLLAAPGLLVPVILKLADSAINFIGGFFH